MPTGEYQNILIVRLSALGDIIFTTSLLEQLRRAYPQAQISWIAQRPFAGIIENDPRLNEVIAVNKSTFSAPAKLLQLRKQLRARHFDAIIDGQGTLKSNIISTLAGRNRIGFAAKRVGKMFMQRAIPKGGDIRDISSEYRFLGHQITGLEGAAPALTANPEKLAAIKMQMEERNISPHFVALAPFTTRPEKHWTEKRWAELIEIICREGKQCVIFGGPGRETETQRMMPKNTSNDGAVVNLVGRTAIVDLPAWFAMADSVIGVDTGLTHLGIALKRPTVALFGATCPYTQGANSPLKVLLSPPNTPAQMNMSELTAAQVWHEMKRMKERTK